MIDPEQPNSHSPAGRLVGEVAEIWRFPVKSMQGERLDTATLHWTGLTGDRQFAFVRSADRSRFPWLTGRVLPELLLYRAVYADPADPRDSPAVVTTPEGDPFDIWDASLADGLSRAAGETVHAMRIGRGAFDQHPVSVVTTATLRRVSDRFGMPVDPRRFRINIVVETTPDAPPETGWTGGTLTFGGGSDRPSLRIDEPAERCVMVTIDPDSARRDARVMRVVAQDFANQVGLYCAPARLGTLAVGNPVFLSGSTGRIQ